MNIQRCLMLLFVLALSLGTVAPLPAARPPANDSQPGTVAEPKWPTLGGDFGRSGQSRDLGPLAGQLRWEFETGGAVVGSVTVGSDGRVHIASEDGKLYTLDSDGRVIWVLDLKTPLLSAPSIAPDGGLYVGAGDGTLTAVDAAGRRRWTYHSTHDPIYSSPAVGADGSIYVGSTGGTVDALDPNGEELWHFKTKGPGALPNGAIFASPSIGPDGTVYVAGLYDPNLYALNPADGSVKWACRFPANSDDPNTGGWPLASPVVAEDGTIYQTLLYDRHLYAIEPADGTIRWSVELSDPPIELAPGVTVPTDGDGWSEPVLGPDGTIYVCLDNPYIHAIDPNGVVKWARPFGEVGGFTMVVDRMGTVYAASDDGFLYVVASDGSELIRYEIGGWPVYPVIAGDNLLIVADSKDYSSLEKDAKNTVWALETRDMEYSQ